LGTWLGTIHTDCGPIALATDDENVIEIRFGCEAGRGRRTNPLLRDLKSQLREYFRGRRREFDLPLQLEAPRFTATVLTAVSEIPFGEIRTYGETAAEAGSPKAARAVGQAVGSNPLPIVIP